MAEQIIIEDKVEFEEEKVLCETCERELTKRQINQSKNRKSKHKYCSIKCHNYDQSKKANLRISNTKIFCEFCKKPIPQKRLKCVGFKKIPKYCSRKCHNYDQSKKDNLNILQKEKMFCTTCRKELSNKTINQQKRRNSKHKYCSRACHRNSIAYYQPFANKQNCYIPPQEYKGSKELHTIICKTCGENFLQTLERVKCGKCKCPNGSFKLGERLVEVALISIFPKYIFEKGKLYDFLINPITKHRLQLDFYCAELRLAIEVQGRQHYEACLFDKKQNNLKKRQFLDTVKRNILKEKGITLIEIPEVMTIIKISKLKNFIINECEKYNYLQEYINKDINNITIDYLPAYNKHTKYPPMKELMIKLQKLIKPPTNNKEYTVCKNSGILGEEFPISPPAVYTPREEWLGWPYFLNQPTKLFEEYSVWCRFILCNKIKSSWQYLILYKRGQLPKNFPSIPWKHFKEFSYKDVNWKKRTEKRNWVDYNKVVQWCINNKVESYQKYSYLFKKRLLPSNFPRVLNKYNQYNPNDFGWKSISPFWNEIVSYILSNKIKSNKEYISLYLQKKLPLNFPRFLTSTYKNEYNSIDLGWKSHKIAPYNALVKFILDNRIENRSKYEILYKNGKIPSNFPLAIRHAYSEYNPNDFNWKTNKKKK